MRDLRLPILPALNRWLPIIGTLATALAVTGCGTVRIAYNNAPSLTYWWVDAYVDLDSEQSSRVRADLQTIQNWHRKDEMPLITQQIASLRTRALAPTTPEQICEAVADFQLRLHALVERTAPTLAAVAPTLTENQLQHLDKEFAKRNAEWSREHLQIAPAERLENSIKLLVERTESFYGKLSESQRALVRANTLVSDFDGETVYREKIRRHQDALQTLAQMRSTPSTPAQLRAAALGVLQRALVSPDARYRQYLARVTQQGCANIAALHNSASPAQRAKLAETLREYEDDLRTLSAPS